MIKSFENQHNIRKGKNMSVICLVICVLAVLPFEQAFSYTLQAKQNKRTTQDVRKTLLSAKNITYPKQPKISLNINKKPLLSVLKEVAKKVHVGISYQKNIIPNKKITVHFKKVSIYQALGEILKGTGLKVVLPPSRDVIVIKKKQLKLQMQQGTVSGTVTDAQTGNTLPGVNILVKGTSNGTATDGKGHYNVNVPSLQDTLRFSFIGYKTQLIPINGRSTIDVKMKIITVGGHQLVVTALGQTREKQAVGYAVQEVQGRSLTKVRSPNVSYSLVGKVAGLDIKPANSLFQNSSITLRGRTPLIVIDGTPELGADLWKINPDNIKNVSVLKGGAATSLYGSKGRNGAILITTKHGAKGTGLKVKFNSSTMAQKGFIRLPHVQTTFGEGDQGNYKYVNGLGQSLEGGGWMWGPKLNVKDPNTKSGYVERVQYNSPIDPKTGKRIPIPWISRGAHNIQIFFRTGLLSTNNLSVNWGGDKGSFRASASNKFQRGVVPNTDLNTTSLMVGGSVKIGNKFNSDGSITYNKEYTHNFPSVGYGPTNYLYNLELWTGADVNVLDLKDYWRKGEKGIQQRNPNITYYNNPYFIAYEHLRAYHKDNVYGYLNLSYNVLPSLSIKFKTGGNLYALDRSTKTPKSFIGTASTKGNYGIIKRNVYNLNSRIAIHYKHEVIPGFSINVTAGGINNFRNYNTASISTDGLVIPEFYNLSNTANPVQGSNEIQKQKTNSLFGIADFSYKQTYFLSLTGRNDWVSTLPIRNNSFFYPSISGSVILSKFLNLPSLINQLKVRGSWSKVSDGEIGGDPYFFIQSYTESTNWNGSNPSLFFGGQLINPNLNPESTRSWEGGLNLGLFDNRLNIDATFYQSHDYDNLVSIPISNASGFTSVLVNGNAYNRKGWEFTVKANPVQTRIFQWNLTLNINTNHRYLAEIYGDEKRLNHLEVGDRTDAIYTSVYETDPENGEIIYQANGYPKSDPFQRFLGYSEPNWIYGMQNSLSFHHFTLDFSLNAQNGGLVYSTLNQKMWWGGKALGEVNQYRIDANHGKSTFVAKGVVVTSGKVTYDSQGNILRDTRKYAPNKTPANYIAFMKSTSGFATHNYQYYSRTFIKLQEASLTYQFPQKWLSHLFIKTASLSLIGSNLWIWAKIPNIDPSVTRAGGQQTPSMRTFGLNINVTF